MPVPLFSVFEPNLGLSLILEDGPFPEGQSRHSTAHRHRNSADHVVEAHVGAEKIEVLGCIHLFSLFFPFFFFSFFFGHISNFYAWLPDRSRVYLDLRDGKCDRHCASGERSGACIGGAATFSGAIRAQCEFWIYFSGSYGLVTSNLEFPLPSSSPI